MSAEAGQFPLRKRGFNKVTWMPGRKYCQPHGSHQSERMKATGNFKVM